MQFREWLIIEMSWHNFDHPVVINDVKADAIDFHFEDWKKGANPQKMSGLIPLVSPQPFINASFSAPLWDGEYINISNEHIPDVGLDRRQWSAVRKFQHMPGAEISPQAKFQKLPPSWFDFASLYLGGKKVKEQMWPRDKEVDDFNAMFRPPIRVSKPDPR